MNNRRTSTPTALAITGGIGSGKSYVAGLLAERFGVPVYDCDTEAKRLNESSPAIRRGLTRLVGPDVYLPDGRLDRQRLARWLFATEEHTLAVDRLIHPVVRADFLAWREAQQAPLVGLESAILYESNLHVYVDRVLFVDAPLGLRLERAMTRDGVSRAAVESRMARQDTDGARLRADFVVVNDGHDLLPDLRRILKTLNPR